MRPVDDFPAIPKGFLQGLKPILFVRERAG
jgi:hypothetical protein